MSGSPRYITLQDTSLSAKPRHLAYYEYSPADSSAIVCVHGLSRNGLDFELLARALAGKYHVICPDMAGRGNSDWLAQASDYTYATYIGDILALLKQLNLSQVDWIGTSMGGIIGMMLAAGQPQLIRRMVLNDIGAVVSAEGLRRILGYVGAAGLFVTKEEADAYLKSVLAPFGIASEKEWQHMFRASFNLLPDGRYTLRYDPAIGAPFRAALSDNNAINDVNLSDFWNTVKCPVLILRGGMSDILTHKTATEMCAGRADVRLVEFPGVGHAPALLSDGQIGVITDWLG